MTKELKITNQESPYYNQMGRIISHLEYERIEFFLLESENIIEISINDLECKNKLFVPKSRKDFYEYINNMSVTRPEIINTTLNLIKQKKIVLNSINENDLMDLIKNEELSRIELVDHLRKSRDEKQFDFLLTNNSYKPSFKKKKFNEK